MQNSTLNSRAAAEANIDGEFGLEDFTYNNTSILQVLSHHLNNTDFLGITVRHTQLYYYSCPHPFTLFICMHIPVNNVSHCAILQGRIFFDQEGIRGGRRLFIYQMRDINGNDDTLLIIWANLRA